MTNPNQTGIFPSDIGARRLLLNVPDGLVASPDVLAEFLDPPESREDWFCWQALDQLALVLRDDDAVTGAELENAIRVNGQILDGLIGWTRDRPAMPNGYADQLPDGMRQSGERLLRGMFNHIGTLRGLCRKPGVTDKAKRALTNYMNVLWEYFECIPLEMEASFEKRAVTLVRDKFERWTKMPWKPGVTPKNVEDGGILIDDGHPLSLPDPTGEPGTGETGTGETGTGETGTGETGGGEPGGGGETGGGEPGGGGETGGGEPGGGGEGI